MASKIKMNEEKPKTGRCEFDVKKQLWVVFNGEEWVELNLTSKDNYGLFLMAKNWSKAI